MKKDAFIAWLLLLILAVVWGSSFILMKKGLDAFHPFQVGALRMILAAVGLLPLMLIRRKKRTFKSLTNTHKRMLVATGMIGNAIPAFLFPLAETRINSATAGVLNALTPLFVWIIGVSFFFLPKTVRQITGVIIGFVGAFLLIRAGENELQFLDNVLYTGFVILATILYGLNANLIKAYLNDLDAITISGYALISASIPYIFYLAGSDFFYRLSHIPEAWESMFFILILAWVGTAMALVLFNHLLKLTDPIFSSSVTYLIPIVAVGWGMLDGEAIFPGQMLGMAIILSGVYLVNRK